MIRLPNTVTSGDVASESNHRVVVVVPETKLMLNPCNRTPISSAVLRLPVLTHCGECGECAGHLFASQLQRTAEKRWTQVSARAGLERRSAGTDGICKNSGSSFINIICAQLCGHLWKMSVRPEATRGLVLHTCTTSARWRPTTSRARRTWSRRRTSGSGSAVTCACVGGLVGVHVVPEGGVIGSLVTRP